MNNLKQIKYIVIVWNKEDHPMGGMRNTENVVYQATIFPMENS